MSESSASFPGDIAEAVLARMIQKREELSRRLRALGEGEAEST